MKKLLYILIAVALMGCTASIGADDIMSCFGKKTDQAKEECKK